MKIAIGTQLVGIKQHMCTELEAAGLPDLVFNNSTVTFKTTVMNVDQSQRICKNARIGDETRRLQRKATRLKSRHKEKKG